MSVYPLCVESTDGKFYKDPCFKGESYFVNMIGNGSPEIIIIQPMTKTASEILDSMRIKHKNLQKVKNCRKRINGKLTEVIIYIFDLVAPIPTPNSFIYFLEKIQSGYTFYDFR